MIHGCVTISRCVALLEYHAQNVLKSFVIRDYLFKRLIQRFYKEILINLISQQELQVQTKFCLWYTSEYLLV